MHTDDVVKGSLGLKSEIASTFGIEAFRPSGNNSPNKFVWRTPDARNYLVASDAAQCLDLLADRARHTGHGEINARAEFFASQARGVDEKTDRGARTCMRMPDRVRD